MDRNESSVEGNCNIVTQGNKNIVSVTNNVTFVNAEYGEMFKAGEFMTLKEKDLQDKNESGTHATVPTKGANVYLSVYILFATSCNSPTGGVEGLSLGVSVTNFNVTHRYFNQPTFKASVPFDGDLDTFYLTSKMDHAITFPKRLEYGEVFTVNYKLSTEIISKFFTKMMEKDSNATIKAVLYTTLGEIFYSNECPVSKIVNVAKQVKKF